MTIELISFSQDVSVADVSKTECFLVFLMGSKVFRVRVTENAINDLLEHLAPALVSAPRSAPPVREPPPDFIVAEMLPQAIDPREADEDDPGQFYTGQVPEFGDDGVEGL